jgi:hypothetical protein
MCMLCVLGSSLAVLRFLALRHQPPFEEAGQAPHHQLPSGVPQAAGRAAHEGSGEGAAAWAALRGWYDLAGPPLRALVGHALAELRAEAGVQVPAPYAAGVGGAVLTGTIGGAPHGTMGRARFVGNVADVGDAVRALTAVERLAEVLDRCQELLG